MAGRAASTANAQSLETAFRKQVCRDNATPLKAKRSIPFLVECSVSLATTDLQDDDYVAFLLIPSGYYLLDFQVSFSGDMDNGTGVLRMALGTTTAADSTGYSQLGVTSAEPGTAVTITPAATVATLGMDVGGKYLTLHPTVTANSAVAGTATFRGLFIGAKITAA